MAEGVRFELTVRVAPYNGFQDRRFQPLSHPSIWRDNYRTRPLAQISSLTHIVSEIDNEEQSGGHEMKPCRPIAIMISNNLRERNESPRIPGHDEKEPS